MDWGNCTFVLQIFIAETIFLYGFPRRKHFKLIYFIGVPVITLLSVFFPMPDYLYTNQFYLFFRFSFLFMVTLGLMALCFKAKAIPTISACASGYALQHLTYHVTALICLTPLLENYQNEVLSQMRLLEIIVFPIVYLLGYLTFGRLAAKHEFYKNYNSYFVLCSVLTLFVCLIISRFARLSSSDDITTIAISVYAITCCLLSLLLNYSINFVSIEKAKAETLERIEYERKNQYEFSKQNSEYLRVQIHDLKHVMSLVDSDKKEELASISKTLEEYDSQIQTGNDDLDLIINEKKSTCRDNNISFTFFGNGKALSFVSKYDIYILFGNILDNAIEAV